MFVYFSCWWLWQLLSGQSKRAGWAELALKTFAQATGCDLESAVADLIADMAHFCDRHGMSISREIDHARGMYSDETDGAGKQFEE